MKKIFSIGALLAFAVIAFMVIDWVIIPHVRAGQKKQFLIIADNVFVNPFKKKLIEEIVRHITQKNPKIEIKVADLAQLNLPALSERISPAQAPIAQQIVKNWADTVSASNAIIFIVPNYHKGYPAIFKNAIDLIWEPWHTKPVMMIGYSLANEDGTNFVDSFSDVLSTIKTEHIRAPLYLPMIAQDAVLNSEMHITLWHRLDALIDASNQSNYLKRLKNAFASKVLRVILKFTEGKK